MIKTRTLIPMLFICLGLFSTRAFSQAKGTTYKTAIGIKAPPAGITVKHFVQRNQALEAIVNAPRGGIRLTALYEFHFDLPGAKGLKLYAGPGLHIGSWNKEWKYERNRWNRDYRGSYAGLDLVLGFDWKVNGVPLNFSLDVLPSYSWGENGYEFSDYWGGIGFRYAF